MAPGGQAFIEFADQMQVGETDKRSFLRKDEIKKEKIPPKSKK